MKSVSMLCAGMLVVLSGCSTPRPALPEDQTRLGQIPGLEGARFFGDINLADSRSYSMEIREQIRATDPAEFDRPQFLLAISGGGQDGAFGAGLLNGWSVRGDRPVFRIVTGISTGALIAPFAFLGESYDPALKEMYTRHSTRDILRKSLLYGLFGGQSVADSTPLLRLIQQYLTPEAIQQIAEEHSKGRRLYIGTTNMDALRPVVWDLGAIASSGHPDRAGMIHRAMLASASIPGAFPPVVFDVVKDGFAYNELHMDGGIGNQIFISPTSFSIREAMDVIGFTQSGTIYIIRNSPTHTPWELIKPSAIALSSASIGGLIRNQGNTDQYVIFLQSQIDEMGFRSAQIPPSFQVESTEAFDNDYMRQLYDLAFEQARNGYPWRRRPSPGQSR